MHYAHPLLSGGSVGLPPPSGLPTKTPPVQQRWLQNGILPVKGGVGTGNPTSIKANRRRANRLSHTDTRVPLPRAHSSHLVPPNPIRVAPLKHSCGDPIEELFGEPQTQEVVSGFGRPHTSPRECARREEDITRRNLRFLR